ncbi:MAG: (Fe-S)-binding protein, partial [Myxococcota bacterium]
GAAQLLYAKHWVPACEGGDVRLCESVATVAAHLGPKPEAVQDVGWALFPTPGGSAFAVILAGLEANSLIFVGHAGFWIHATLVMLFLNLLPISKHFHIITAIPNVFVRDLTPPGRLEPMGTMEELGDKVMEAYDAHEAGQLVQQPVGVGNIEDFTWKAILDFYTCTECGRCSDHCPAHRTGKILSPKLLTVALRDHLYAKQIEVIEDGVVRKPIHPDLEEEEDEVEEEPFNLVGDIVHPDVLWACTTCRSCEEQCPVMISYVDKIVDMRRNLVMVRGEFPAEVGRVQEAVQTNGNPWNISAMDRANWADGLDIPMMSEKPDAEILFWVGCAASYDDRSKKIARATAKLFKKAGINFAILGEEETCTGDPLRRAGDEYTFAMQAETNAGTLNGYKDQGGVKKIVSTCPHCFNTLANEYPDFGAKFEVVHHSEFLDELVQAGKLKPTKKRDEKVVFHDSCYLGRYNDRYEEPRRVLKVIPGVELVEAEGANRKKGLCCGAGGMQMFMEEQNKDRMNNRRVLQLLDTGATTIASGCPFCTVMLTDGIKSKGKEEAIKQLDIAEVLAEACEVDDEVKVAPPQAAE